MPTTDNHEDTPWEPHSIREKIAFTLINIIETVFAVDYFDMYRRKDVSYDEIDGYYRIGMGAVEDLRDEWLEVYKIQSEYYDDNADDDWVAYCMWLVMRADKTINPPVMIHGERTEDGWNVSTNDKPEEVKKQKRKEEILREVDNRGFIDPVLTKDSTQTVEE